MKKKLTLNKKELIKLWKDTCSNARINTILDNVGSADGQMYSIKLDDSLSLSLFNNEIKIIFSEQIEYLSEKISEEEGESLKDAFFQASDTIERLTRDKIMSDGIKALERLIDK